MDAGLCDPMLWPIFNFRYKAASLLEEFPVGSFLVRKGTRYDNFTQKKLLTPIVLRSSPRTPSQSQSQSQFTVHREVHSSQFPTVTVTVRHSSQFTVHSSQFTVHSSQFTVTVTVTVHSHSTPLPPRRTVRYVPHCSIFRAGWGVTDDGVFGQHAQNVGNFVLLFFRDYVISVRYMRDGDKETLFNVEIHSAEVFFFFPFLAWA